LEVMSELTDTDINSDEDNDFEDQYEDWRKQPKQCVYLVYLTTQNMKEVSIEVIITVQFIIL
jgi:hypothetical protein